MKKTLKTLYDGLVYQLQSMAYAETVLKNEFSIRNITSVELREHVKNYIEQSDDKLLKLERVFSYLMYSPMVKKNPVIDKFMKETRDILSSTSPRYLRDILLISWLQKFNAYKISGYKAAWLYALEMELEVPAELIQEILVWEHETDRLLGQVVIEEFNRRHRQEKVS